MGTVPIVVATGIIIVDEIPPQSLYKISKLFALNVIIPLLILSGGKLEASLLIFVIDLP